MKNPVVHFEIGCKDQDLTKGFYESTFGWDIIQAGPSANIDTKSEEGIQGHITALGHEPHNYINIYIGVDDINECLERIEKNGGNKAIGPIKLPTGQEFAWFIDVAGNTVGLITKKE